MSEEAPVLIAELIIIVLSGALLLFVTYGFGVAILNVLTVQARRGGERRQMSRNEKGSDSRRWLHPLQSTRHALHLPG